MEKPHKRSRISVKYIKSPQAPKRFKSAFIFFTMARHKSIRKGLTESGEGVKTTDVAKLVSEEWRNLPKETREYWNQKAALDKLRYEKEKSAYTGPWKIPAGKRKSKDPLAPKRPMSSFLAFSNAKRDELRKQHPTLSNTNISKLLANMWKKASAKEKEVYIDQEARLRAKYKVEMALWNEKVKDKEDGTASQHGTWDKQEHSYLEKRLNIGNIEPSFVASKTFTYYDDSFNAIATADQSSSYSTYEEMRNIYQTQPTHVEQNYQYNQNCMGNYQPACKHAITQEYPPFPSTGNNQQHSSLDKNNSDIDQQDCDERDQFQRTGNYRTDLYEPPQTFMMQHQHLDEYHQNNAYHRQFTQNSHDGLQSQYPARQNSKSFHEAQQFLPRDGTQNYGTQFTNAIFSGQESEHTHHGYQSWTDSDYGENYTSFRPKNYDSF